MKLSGRPLESPLMATIIFLCGDLKTFKTHAQRPRLKTCIPGLSKPPHVALTSITWLLHSELEWDNYSLDIKVL